MRPSDDHEIRLEPGREPHGMMSLNFFKDRNRPMNLPKTRFDVIINCNY